jgi:hypothetical protein
MEARNNLVVDNHLPFYAILSIHFFPVTFTIKQIAALSNIAPS